MPVHPERCISPPECLVDAGEQTGTGCRKSGEQPGWHGTGHDAMPEQRVGGFAQRDDRCLRTSRLVAHKPYPAKLVGPVVAGRLSETRELGRIIEPVEGLLGIVAQHHRVGDIERQNAAREPMRGPRNRHAWILTGNSYLTS